MKVRQNLFGKVLISHGSLSLVKTIHQIFSNTILLLSIDLERGISKNSPNDGTIPFHDFKQVSSASYRKWFDFVFHNSCLTLSGRGRFSRFFDQSVKKIYGLKWKIYVCSFMAEKGFQRSLLETDLTAPQSSSFWRNPTIKWRSQKLQKLRFFEKSLFAIISGNKIDFSNRSSRMETTKLGFTPKCADDSNCL